MRQRSHTRDEASTTSEPCEAPGGAMVGDRGCAGTDALAHWDQRLSLLGTVRTLHPSAPAPTPLRELAAAFEGFEGQTKAALRGALASLAEATLRHFPETIFWDFDGVTGALQALALSSEEDPVAVVEQWASLMVEIHELFGRFSTIRFRYTHDLIYGFDWARWVAKDPASRQAIGPYDLDFLRTMKERGLELLALIEGKDTKYGPLPQGEPRNPFCFFRDPTQEWLLHRALAKDGWIPVEAWAPTGQRQWQKPFGAYRDQRAFEMGFSKGKSAGEGADYPADLGTGTPMPT